MKILAVVCGLLIMASCRDKVQIHGVDDSTPIIVSDGSVHVKRDKGFEKLTGDKKHAEAKHTKFVPAVLGYKCDVGPYANTSQCGKACPAAPVSTCYQMLNSAIYWKLAFDTDAPDEAPAVTLSWLGLNGHKISISFLRDYVESGDELVTAALPGAPTVHLKSATLQVFGGAKIDFPCSGLSTGQTCLSLGFKE